MKFAAKKLASLALTMLIVTAMTFLAFSLISGDPASTMLGTNATPEQVEALRDELGLNKPIHQRYFEWIKGFFTGDLGNSYKYRNQSVTSLIAPRLGVTLELSALSFVLIILISLPLGVIAAGAKSRFYRVFRSALNRLCMAVPSFFIGLLVTWIFGITLKWFSHGAFVPWSVSPAASLLYLFYPAVCIAVPRIAMTVNMLSSTVEAELKKDYARTVRSRGAGSSRLLFVHVLKNSLAPIVTFLGQTAAEIIAASVVIEQVFVVPGLGRFLVSSISYRDYPVVEAIVVLLALWVVLASTAADLINFGVDPRLRRGAKG
ncbi:MAG: ABC transporter permease [Oscillospiraceae bacterium]|nr:ABC transporter permease [Oscillospiraceae bacterium]